LSNFGGCEELTLDRIEILPGKRAVDPGSRQPSDAHRLGGRNGFKLSVHDCLYANQMRLRPF
jgi:hypothetical protein